jgi:hypothetical protein
MESFRSDHVPRHPAIERRSLVLWPGYRSGIDFASVDRRVVGSVAIPLKHARTEAAAAASAERRGLGLVFPGQAWLNQLPNDNAARSSGFRALTYAFAKPLRPDAGDWSEAFLAEYADAFVDEQLAAGATLATTPAHVIDESGPGRDQDLRLTQAAVAAFEARQGSRPPPQRPDDPSRELYATIVVDAQSLPAVADQLADGYGSLTGIKGYWIVLMNCTKSRRQLGALADLALALQETSGRPAVVSGAAGLHCTLLASGVAAACAGFQAMAPAYPPPELPDTDDGGIGVPIYHPAILGVVPLGKRYDLARLRLFGGAPCHCGAHLARVPPRGRAETLRHNEWHLQVEVYDAVRFAPVVAEPRILARAARAAVLRHELGLGSLPVSWDAAALTARRRRGTGPSEQTA